MKLASIVIDTSNALRLAEFYQNLLGWEMKIYNHGEEGDWITLSNKESSTTRLVFQEVENYKKPVWYGDKKEQQIMMHLDFYTENVEESVEKALALGATKANEQYGDWVVMFDLDGHPFCIVPTRKR